MFIGLNLALIAAASAAEPPLRADFDVISYARFRRADMAPRYDGHWLRVECRYAAVVPATDNALAARAAPLPTDAHLLSVSGPVRSEPVETFDGFILTAAQKASAEELAVGERVVLYGHARALPAQGDAPAALLLEVTALEKRDAPEAPAPETEVVDITGPEWAPFGMSLGTYRAQSLTSGAAFEKDGRWCVPDARTEQALAWDVELCGVDQNAIDRIEMVTSKDTLKELGLVELPGVGAVRSRLGGVLGAEGGASLTDLQRRVRQSLISTYGPPSATKTVEAGWTDSWVDAEGDRVELAPRSLKVAPLVQATGLVISWEHPPESP